MASIKVQTINLADPAVDPAEAADPGAPIWSRPWTPSTGQQITLPRGAQAGAWNPRTGQFQAPQGMPVPLASPLGGWAYMGRRLEADGVLRIGVLALPVASAGAHACAALCFQPAIPRRDRAGESPLDEVCARVCANNAVAGGRTLPDVPGAYFRGFVHLHGPSCVGPADPLAAWALAATLGVEASLRWLYAESNDDERRDPDVIELWLAPAAIVGVEVPVSGPALPVPPEAFVAGLSAPDATPAAAPYLRRLIRLLGTGKSRRLTFTQTPMTLSEHSILLALTAKAAATLPKTPRTTPAPSAPAPANKGAPPQAVAAQRQQQRGRAAKRAARAAQQRAQAAAQAGANPAPQTIGRRAFNHPLWGDVIFAGTDGNGAPMVVDPKGYIHRADPADLTWET